MKNQYNIGLDINQICSLYKIDNYTIREDGKVDVDGSVSFFYNNLTKFPIYFGKVKGNFYCDNNHLTTLKGSPESVDGDFFAYSNRLTNLDYIPKEIGGSIDIWNNQLTSLKGLPEVVNGYLGCSYNLITSFEYYPRKINGTFYIKKNKITSLENCPNEINGNFELNENNIFDISPLRNCKFNKLFIHKNPISKLLYDIKDIEHYLLINPINGKIIYKELYDEVREDLELEPFDYNKLHKEYIIK